MKKISCMMLVFCMITAFYYIVIISAYKDQDVKIANQLDDLLTASPL